MKELLCLSFVQLRQNPTDISTFRSRGFSLVEMLVVVAILGLLAGLSIPAIEKARSFAQQTTCTANLRTLHQATMNYASENDGLFPCAIHPTNNFAITLACEGYLGLPGAGFWERLDSWIALSQRRAAFCLWCPMAEACEPRAPYGNMATYCMNVNVGQDFRVPTSRKVSQVSSPAKTSLYMDGCFTPGRGYDVRVGETGLLPSPMHPPNLYKQTNNPARSVNVVFVDGHVEMRRIATLPTDFNDVFWTPAR